MCCCVVMALPPVATAQSNPDWSKPYEPFRVAGNVYYVGTYDLACYLVVTPKGNILINQALGTTVDLLKRNIEKLGFRLGDTKILLISQAHFDHVGGLAKLKKMTGAKVMIDEADAPVVEDGGKTDFLYGGHGKLFDPVKVDRRLRDHDLIELGGTTLEFLHHPGHTKGSCSYLLTTRDEQREWRLLIANVPFALPEVRLPGMPTYTNIGTDLEQTIKSMRALKFDIWVAAHASQFGLHTVRKEGDAYNPSVFGNRMTYLQTMDQMEELRLEKLHDSKE